MLNKQGETLNTSMQDNSFSMRNNTLKSRDKAHGHLPQIPMTPPEEKRSSKNQDRYKNANNEQYLASGGGGSTIDQIRAQSH